MIDRSQPDWYRDAVIYQLHVKSFMDGNDDGIGDFPGLIQKLDYIQGLGVTCLWLLPFYPSPLRDDGYDIGDYRGVNPNYGSLKDFRALVKQAHARGLRVITELVVNHTSDQHPWFQRARRARRGSPWRDFYVWSDSDKKYAGTRIIFLDTEQSNWTWDPVAGQYYWHRFYSHQPDLNFDNPRVLREVLNVMHFWLEAGVDGLRLDAVPYLCEREGTNNENLPETHRILKQIRAEVDQRYPDRMLLAEANQWPEDVKEYFGSGDECHMAFHFPLMPRMYMAIAQEDRHPITDIIRQTPEIPEGCQWAIFLRNHDELTLEMVTDRERDYLWNFYAGDRRMRINLGIRRRLAPLMDSDRRKIELMTSLLLSMPGTPVVYYGDEIGMGDNVYLGDRDGVRTPMQWSPDRNGGFSRANPSTLFLPTIMDPTYGFQALNVEAQSRNPWSLLNWTRRIIGVRQGRAALFGRGALRFLYPGNRKILAYLREHEGEAVLVVANLSRAAQPVELDLAEFRGAVPVELLGRSTFPPIGTLPYLLTLAPYSFYWFALAQEAELPGWHLEIPQTLPEFVTLVVRMDWEDMVTGRELAQLERDVLPGWLAMRRWFAAKDASVKAARIAAAVPLGGPDGGHLVTVIDVETGSGPGGLYVVPLAAAWGEEALTAGAPFLPYTLARLRSRARLGALHDATVDERFARAVIARMIAGENAAGIAAVAPRGLTFCATRRLVEAGPPGEVEIRLLPGQQRNSSIIVGEFAVLKILRRATPGIHPEVEIGRYLTEEAGFANTPALLGWMELEPAAGEAPAVIGLMQQFVRNQGDGWRYTLEWLARFFEDWSHTTPEERPPAHEAHGVWLTQAAILGRRTAELHAALARPTEDPAFAPEPITGEDLAGWRQRILAEAEASFATLARLRPQLEDAATAAVVDRALGLRDRLAERLDALVAGPPQGVRTRLHGDFHLGQVLVVQNDFHIIDFEGEPARSLDERRAKTTPLKDVAGMLRSFDYAAAVSARTFAVGDAALEAQLAPVARDWLTLTLAAYLEAYRAGAEAAGLWYEGSAENLVALFTIEKALHEIGYEAANRPDWLAVPVSGLVALIEEGLVLARAEAPEDG